MNERAIADYSKAVELTPNSAAALSGRGRANLAAYRPHGAIRDFTRAVSLDARFSAAYRSRAEAKMAIDRYEDAIEDFSRAIAFEPRNPEIYALRGAAYMEANNASSGRAASECFPSCRWPADHYAIRRSYRE